MFDKNTQTNVDLFYGELNTEFAAINIYNVSTQIPLTAGNYYTKTTARAAIPSAVKKLGQNITYITALREIERLTITATPTVSGNVTITLNGAAFTVALDTTTETTIALTAAKIALTAPTGWIVAYTAGSTYLEYAKSVIGVCANSIYSAGSTAATASFSTTQAGTNEQWITEQFIGSNIANWTVNSNWRSIFIDDLIVSPIPLWVSGFFSITGAEGAHGSFSRFTYNIQLEDKIFEIKAQADGSAYCLLIDSIGTVIYTFQIANVLTTIDLSLYPLATKLLVSNRNTTIAAVSVIFRVIKSRIIAIDSEYSGRSYIKTFSPTWTVGAAYNNISSKVKLIAGGSASSAVLNIHGSLSVTLNLSTSTLKCIFTDSNNNVISEFANTGVTLIQNVPEGAVILYVNNFTQYQPNPTITASLLFSNITKSVSEDVGNLLLKNISDNEYLSTYYVATTGLATNDGTEASPLLTLASALSKHKKGCITTIIIKSGEYYDYGISLANYPEGEIIIKNYGDGKVLFTKKNVLKNNGSETLESGFTKVYSIPCTTDYNQNGIIFQHGINYGLIDISERHPLQRGQAYRLNSTPIYYAKNIDYTEFSNDTDAKNFIENSIGYYYYYSATSSKLFFSRPLTTSITNPLLYANGEAMIVGARKIELKMDGVDLEYLYLSLDYCGFPILKNVSVKYAKAMGAIRLDNNRGAILERCEAACCGSSKTIGDGINIHSSPIGSTGTEFTYTHATLIDCWCHDNNDDGYSDHEGCQVTIQGGLSEYNKKGGFTPSTGAHDTFYNCISRKNYNGFYYINNPADGGVGGQALCFNCAAENNSQSGFRNSTSANNKSILIGCKSIGNDIGYNLEAGAMKCVDCGSISDNTVKSGDVEIVNTILLT
jgi:hypothetical protein